MKFLQKSNLYFKPHSYMIYFLGSVASVCVILFGMSIGVFISKVFADNPSFKQLLVQSHIPQFVSGADIFVSLMMVFIFHNLFGFKRQLTLTPSHYTLKQIGIILISLCIVWFGIPYLKHIEVTSQFNYYLFVPFVFGACVNMYYATRIAAKTEVLDDIFLLCAFACVSGVLSYLLLLLFNAEHMFFSFKLLLLFIYSNGLILFCTTIINTSILKANLAHD